MPLKSGYPQATTLIEWQMRTLYKWTDAVMEPGTYGKIVLIP